MRIILHGGVHCTDDDKLLKVLLRNADRFRASGTAIPGPGRYRALLSDTLATLGDNRPSPEARDVLMDAILSEDSDKVERMVLSHENIFCVPKLMFSGGRYYRNAEMRLRAMSEMFAGDQLELYLALRNPATLLPAVLAVTPHETVGNLLGGIDPLHLRWSHLIERIRMELPDMPITVWCNEDTPLLWGELIRRIAGVPAGSKIAGAFDLLTEIMMPEGMKRFRAYLAENPELNEAQRRRAKLAFLDKYARDDVIEEELDVPGWDEAFIDKLTEIYDEDLEMISTMDGVTVIDP
ncbi:hypothetical protein [Pseudoprimorskyibacter insulae]|uniref:Sulfotransferase domain-containing protein n=1 Tax=Pseudoprimorskyibacter insulae TaxID=1695997 RepID=A0A2R8B0Z2_9RHOB|nr:hypothetical protein [Pseudoprimorskyibacter insulae]SPF81952.1 hypothetical protein PRI8871_03779 [Pseudoprimorskyibacter insulae]